MTETVGVSATSTLPTDQVQLLQLLIIEVRVMNLMLKEGLGIKEEIYSLRNDLLKTVEVVIT